MGSERASGTTTPFSGSQVQHFMLVTWSYLSSSRSSTIASLVIFAGGSSSSDWSKGKVRWQTRRNKAVTHALDRWFGFPPHVKSEPVSRFANMGPRMMPYFIQTSTIKASETHVDTIGAILDGHRTKPQQCWSEHQSVQQLTWLSKHWVHSSRCTLCDSLGGCNRVSWSTCGQIMVGCGWRSSLVIG